MPWKESSATNPATTTSTHNATVQKSMTESRVSMAQSARWTLSTHLLLPEVGEVWGISLPPNAPHVKCVRMRPLPWPTLMVTTCSARNGSAWTSRPSSTVSALRFSRPISSKALPVPALNNRADPSPCGCPGMA